MTYGSWRHDQRTLDTLAADLLPACPVCGDLCAPSATVCECGARLTPRTTTAPERASLDGPRAQGQEVNMLTHSPDCTCTRCYLEEFESGPVAPGARRLSDALHGAGESLRALDGHGNVVSLHGYSKKVTS